ncbi:MAG: protein translocase subunit SecF [Patescibacteria group bacterium]|nr:protein translocase subunit SecF [Patescibacteria group bacterium]
MYNIIGQRKIFFAISGGLIGLSVLFLILFGLKPGIDFTGGTMMEIKYRKEMPSSEEIKEKIKEFDLGEVIIQPTHDQTFVLRFKEVDEETHQKILKKLGQPEEIRFESIGPIIGRELINKARWAVILAVIAILIYIAWAFRRLSKIIKRGESWRYGAGAILALIHDVLVMLGVFAFLGRFRNVEINTPFIIAILTVLGYSVNDTIVIYDRIRENFLFHPNEKFEITINRSLNETIIRSLNTTITTLLALLAIFFFGGETIRYFVLAMMVGIATGAWSSISIAAPFLLFKRK